MTIAVFIAKDQDEFDAYDGMPYDASSGFDSDSSDDGADDLIDSIGDTASIKVEWSDDIDSVCIILKRSTDVDELKDVIRTGRVADNCLTTFVKDYIEKNITEVVVGEPTHDNVVHVFCHWGDGGDAGGVSDMDNAFQEVFARWKQANNDYVKWDVQAISSMRKEIFNVTDVETGAKWRLKKLPSSEAEVKELSDKLAAESKKHSNRVYQYSYDAQDFASLTNDGQVATIVPLLIIPVTAASTVGKLAEVIKEACRGLGYGPLEIDKLSGVEKFYPLFVDFEYAMGNGKRVRVIDGAGFSIPNEFVLRFEKGKANKTDGALTVDLVRDMLLRMKAWRSDEKLKEGLSAEDIKDWMAGAFRRFCMLDEDVHGTAGNEALDVRELKKNPDKVWREYSSKIKKRFDGESIFKQLWSVVYKNQMASLSSCLDRTKRLSNKKRGEKFYNEVVFNPNGSQVAYFSPVIKVSGMLVDDDAENAKKDIEWKTKNVISIKPISVWADKTDKTVAQQALLKFEEIKKSYESYDFALLDLRLADQPGDDPSGYYLISLIKQFFPNLPIIIYSRYDDMGHMSRAFKMGADWFIRKDEIEKLPRHLLSILSIRNWRKEWEAIKRLELCNDPIVVCKNLKKKEDFEKAYAEERKYLTCKCLEKWPGKDIEVAPTGGGFSSSATFCARKWAEVKEDGKSTDATRQYIQDPVIIKIDTAFNTMTEYERYFRFIRPYIANESGRVESKEITLDHNNSAITYTFAGKNDSSRVLDTMKNMLAEDVRYMARCDYKKYEAVFDEIFNDILPKIHRVSPKNPNLESPISSYPNRIFGEKDWKDGGFIGNYLARIPLLRSVSVKEFVDQGAPGSVPFEMHGVATEGEQKVIETYEIKDPKSGKYEYSKLNVILKGDVVDHVARYRELKQGQTLWVKLSGKDKNDTLTMDSVILDKLIEMLYSKDCKNKDKDGNPTFYDGEKEQTFDLKHNSNTKEEQSRKTFCKLVKTLILGHTPDDGRDLTDLIFDSMVDSMYKTTCDVCAASDSNVRFKCKVGIVHGDLNYANIMVDSKKDGTVEDAKDVWLIDFARTRRDIIAHDFNVIFTATFSQLFNNDLWNDKGIDDNDATRYAARLTKIFPRLIKDAMFAESDEEPDYLYVMEDRRFTLFYKIFRRIRKAALSNDNMTENMTEDMYALTTALCCLYTFKVFLKYEKNIQGAAALLATAYICLEHLKGANKE